MRSACARSARGMGLARAIVFFVAVMVAIFGLLRQNCYLKSSPDHYSRSCRASDVIRTTERCVHFIKPTQSRIYVSCGRREYFTQLALDTLNHSLPQPPSR